MLKKLFCILEFLWFHTLNHNNRLASVWRVISFEIASKIIKAPIILPFVNETQLIIKYLRNLDEIQSRISKKNAFILGMVQKI